MRSQEAIIAELTDSMLEFIKQLVIEGDRAVVVLGAARIDVALEHLLKAVMVHHSGGADNLFEPDRPLGTFSAKIALAYRLNLIDSDIEHALQMIRKVRNDFAHSITRSSLSESHHKNRVAELNKATAKSLSSDGIPHQVTICSAISSKLASTELSQFCAAVTVLLIQLEVAVARVEPFQPTYKATLAP